MPRRASLKITTRNTYYRETRAPEEAGFQCGEPEKTCPPVTPFASHQVLSRLPFLLRRAGQLAAEALAIHTSAAAHPGQVPCSTQVP